jgi:PIN domain nuclease of toxin-antitoxin system
VTSYLLDTNAFLWLAFDPTAIRNEPRRLLADAPLFVSVVSAAEIAIKAAIGKLALPPPFGFDFEVAFASMAEREGVDLLPLELSATSRLRSLPLHHRDPFDRMLICQAIDLGLTLATSDHAFGLYGGLGVLEL